MKLFSAKTYYLYETNMKPSALNDLYVESSYMFEERITLLYGSDLDHAILLAEEEANEYASEVDYINPYGEKVSCRYIKLIDVYESEALLEITGVIEIFSTTEVYENCPSFDNYSNAKMGIDYSEEKEKKLRFKFRNKEFNSLEPSSS